MNEATIAQIVLTVAILIVFIGFMIWAIRSGQFKNVEEAKYRMLDDAKKPDEVKNEPSSTAEKGDDKKP
jgi:cbb3-type cytochrome oxidase maturation protein